MTSYYIECYGLWITFLTCYIHPSAFKDGYPSRLFVHTYTYTYRERPQGHNASHTCKNISHQSTLSKVKIRNTNIHKISSSGMAQINAQLWLQYGQPT